MDGISMRGVRPLWLASLALLLGASPAAGLGDMTGTYEGKGRCKITSDGSTENLRLTSAVELQYIGNGRYYGEVPGLLFANTFVAVFQDDARKPESKGTAALVSCTPNDDPPGAATGVFAVKAKPGDVKARIKGTFQAVGNNLIAECKLKISRVDTANPASLPCIPAVAAPRR